MQETLKQKVPGSGGEATQLQAEDLYIWSTFNDYEKQTNEGFRPRKDRPAVRLVVPIDWALSPFEDSNWLFHLHSWRMIDPIMKEWFARPNSALVEEMWSYAADWWRYHKNGGRCAMSWYDMAVGVRAIRLAFFLQLHRDGQLTLSAADQTTLAELVNAHAADLRNPAKLARSNHGIFQAVGYRLLGRQAPACELLADSEVGSAAYMQEILDAQYTPEGIQKEHSPGYHIWVSGLLRDLRVAEWFAEVPLITQRVQAAIENQGWFIQSDGVVARIGDTRARREPPKSLSPSPGWETNEYAVGDFSKSGWIIIRSRPQVPIEQQSMLFFTAMAHSYTHKHADDLSFEWFDRGRRILIDSGLYSFHRDEMRHYVETSAAHNTVDFADRSIGRSDTAPYGSGLAAPQFAEDSFVLSGKVCKRAKKFDHSRRLIWKPGRSLAISDHLVAEKTYKFVSRLHFDTNLTLHNLGADIVAAFRGRAIAKIVPPSEASVQIVRAREGDLLGWESPDYRVIKPVSVIEAYLPEQLEMISEWTLTLI